MRTPKVNHFQRVLRLQRSENGQILILTALSMTLLMGFMALAVDVGLLFRARRNVQIAADAAAVAAALDYKYNSSDSSARTAGQAAAAANGVAAAYVTINPTPVNGAYAAHTGFKEAVISEPAPTFFMKMFHSGAVNVAARAVAGSGVNGACLWALSLSGTDVSLTGSGAITAQNCDIYDNSNASNALTLTGSGSISAKSIGIVGGFSRTGSGSISPNPPTTGMAPAASPINPTAPTAATGTCTGGSCVQSFSGSSNNSLGPGTYTSIKNTGSGKLTLTPGNYIITGDLTNTGSGSLVLGAGNYTIGGDFKSTGSSSLTVGAGIYSVGGNLQLTGSGALSGSNVTFFTAGSSTVTGSGNVNLTAPTSGQYSGLLFDQTAGGAVSLTGSGGDKIQGILYAPNSALTLTGSGSMTVSLDIIVDHLSVTGSGSITDTNYSAVTNTNSILSKLIMVE